MNNTLEGPLFGLVRLCGRITQDEAKLKAKYATRVENVLSPKLLRAHVEDMLSSTNKMKLVLTKLGPPLVRVRDFESTPGIWIIKDIRSTVEFFIWSDEYKVHPWKGTSIEVYCKEADKGPTLEDAWKRFAQYLNHHAS